MSGGRTDPMATTQDIKDILSRHPLFSACASPILDVALSDCHLSTFATGDIIKSYDDLPILCIIVSGKVYVHSKEGSSDLLLRVLHPDDTFGVATLFGAHGTDPITRVTAATPTVALCISESAMRTMLAKDPALAMRYIEFLADRIRFLNTRISCLGAGSAEQKLCAWLESVIPDGEESYTYTLRVPMNKLADVLGLGRASLYRAFDELSARGILSRNGKHIHIPHRASLRAFGEG